MMVGTLEIHILNTILSGKKATFYFNKHKKIKYSNQNFIWIPQTIVIFGMIWAKHFQNVNVSFPMLSIAPPTTFHYEKILYFYRHEVIHPSLVHPPRKYPPSSKEIPWYLAGVGNVK